jgi:hypothetical protein
MGKAKISDDEPKKPQGDKGKKQEIDLTNLPDRRAGENFLADIFGTRRRNPVDRAQEVMYQAWEAPSKKKRVSLAQKALEISLNCADAYCLLAEETAKGPQQAIDLYQKGVQAGGNAPWERKPSKSMRVLSGGF